MFHPPRPSHAGRHRRRPGAGGFGAFGPWIDTDFDPSTAALRTRVGGRERQNHALSDRFFSPAERVSRLPHDLTLLPGDVSLCGTSLGAMPRKPGTTTPVKHWVELLDEALA